MTSLPDLNLKHGRITGIQIPRFQNQVTLTPGEGPFDFERKRADSLEVNNKPEDTETEDDSDHDDVTDDTEPTLDNEGDVDMVSTSLFLFLAKLH